MKIILLSGAKNSGKTTTLNMVYAQLVQGQQNPPPKKPISGKPPYMVDHNTKSIPISELDKDFGCELTYKNKKVAIYSMGDILWRTYRTIIEFCCTDIEFLIIAHQSTGGVQNNYLESSIAAYKCHCVIPKTANNQADCQAIISKIVTAKYKNL